MPVLKAVTIYGGTKDERNRNTKGIGRRCHRIRPGTAHYDVAIDKNSADESDG